MVKLLDLRKISSHHNRQSSWSEILSKSHKLYDHINYMCHISYIIYIGHITYIRFLSRCFVNYSESLQIISYHLKSLQTTWITWFFNTFLIKCNLFKNLFFIFFVLQYKTMYYLRHETIKTNTETRHQKLDL